MVPTHVVKPKQKLLRTLLQVGKLVANWTMILADCIATSLRAIEPNAECISFVIVDRIPIIPFFSVPPWRWSIMMPAPKQVMQAKRSHVIDHCFIRVEHQA